MANTRFFIKTVDPENPYKEKVVWGSSLMGSDPNDETEADCGVWAGLMYISESNEEWGKNSRRRAGAAGYGVRAGSALRRHRQMDTLMEEAT